MDYMLLVWLVIAILVILVLILKAKLNPAIALIIGALTMALGSGLALAETTTTITQGFGALMTGIGLSIGFGVILGQLLSDSGGARVIAQTLVRRASPRFALYSLGLTAFLLSIPVFYDVTFVILIPLAIAMSRELRRPLPYTVGAITIGAGTAHTLVPPTPNPLAAGEILGFDVGIMVAVGLVIGILAALIAMKLYFWLLDRGLWNAERDQVRDVAAEQAAVEAEGEHPMRAPSFWLSLLPIAAPVILILTGTVSGAVMDEVPGIIQFISDKTIALLIGALLAYLITVGKMTGEQWERSSSEALKNTGVVLLITGAGGSFGAVIAKTGMADAIGEAVSGATDSPIVGMLLAFGIAAVFRFALGSGTVASITAMTIMASVAPAMGIHPVWIAIACLSGSLSVGHVNDSGFWVSANLAGYSVTGGLKSYTLGNAIVGVLAMVFAMIGALVIPL